MYLKYRFNSVTSHLPSDVMRSYTRVSKNMFGRPSWFFSQVAKYASDILKQLMIIFGNDSYFILYLLFLSLCNFSAKTRMRCDSRCISGCLYSLRRLKMRGSQDHAAPKATKLTCEMSQLRLIRRRILPRTHAVVPLCVPSRHFAFRLLGCSTLPVINSCCSADPVKSDLPSNRISQIAKD